MLYRWLMYLVAACFAASPGAAQGSAPTLTPTQPGQIEQFWFSGAELNRYDLNQSRYGEDHPGHAEFIFVTEPFDLQQQVKSDTGGAGTKPVLKLNALRTFNTGLYSYRTMLSTFTPIDDLAAPHALKETLSVQDWCGQVFTQINRRDGNWNIQSFSYFQSDGDQAFSVDAQDAWLEEELFTVVRLNPAALPTGAFRAMPSQLAFRFAHQQPQVFDAEGALTETKGEKLVYTVSYPRLNRALRIEFDREFPHIIRRWDIASPSGVTTAELADRQMNVNYWRHNQPGDRAMRRKLGLAPTPK